ncbi:MAG: D-alanine--D-alanine ligase [Nocardiopsaceae bacterium]|jgi:D-alanine-D-alanine ligase|nr:D-alanine--D-alanine ligase [Nocardiopsaceae bacterium]
MTGSLDGVKVVVVCGGTSAEAEVSLVTGQMVAEALERCGAMVRTVQPDGTLIDALRAGDADVVFPALHGPLGEDGCLQGLLEYHGVPYAGSGVRASACANDKITAKRIFRDAGLPLAADLVVSQAGDRAEAVKRVQEALGEDVVVKPACQGSAIGVSFARGPEELAAALAAALEFGDDVLVEERIQGGEITAGVLDLGGSPGPLPLIDIRTPAETWYDYQHRYTAGLSEHVIPAPLPESVYRLVQETAVSAHQVLGCRHLSRVDFVVSPAGRVALLEVNTMPGMTPTSLYPDAARHAGYSFDDLVSAFIRDALGRPG